MSPIERYKLVKEEHPGALLLFKVGEFHELYFEDAEAASKVLGLSVVTRSTDHAQMAGFPSSQLELSLQKLVKAGFRVAVCEQVEDPHTLKGTPPRATKRVVKPKFKPNSATRVFVSNEAGDEEEFDICLGETITGSESLLITQDLDNPKLFQLTHRNTGYALLRTALDYAETKDRGEKFWSRLPDKIRKLYDESDDPAQIYAYTPAHLKTAVRSGKFE